MHLDRSRSILMAIDQCREKSFCFVLFSEAIEMKIGSDNTSPINDSTSTIDNQHQARSSPRTHSSRTVLTEVVA